MIGVALEVEHNVLESLSRSNKVDSTRLHEVLKSWMNTMSSDVTWETIIEALEAPVLNHNLTAGKIRQFLSDPKTYSKYQRKSDFVRQ